MDRSHFVRQFPVEWILIEASNKLYCEGHIKRSYTVADALRFPSIRTPLETGRPFTVPLNSPATEEEQQQDMAPLITAKEDTDHAALLDQLDMLKVPKPFKNPDWKAPSRRNKTVKQILADEAREEARKEAAASAMATDNNSEAVTPAAGAVADNITVGAHHTHEEVADPMDVDRKDGEDDDQEEIDWDLRDDSPPPELVERAKAKLMANPGAPATYTNIDAAPSTHPGHRCKKYCDITGLPAKYRDPKTNLHYCNKEMFAVVRSLTPQQVEERLALRNAHTVLK